MSQAIPHIGAALRYVRHTLRLKIELVAQDAGCAPSNLSRIENGRQQPSVPLLQALAQALDTPVSELYALVEADAQARGAQESGNDAKTPALQARDWIEARRKLEGLSASRRRELLDHLDALHEAQQLDRRLAGHAALSRALESHGGHAAMGNHAAQSPDAASDRMSGRADPINDGMSQHTAPAGNGGSGGSCATAVPLAPLPRR